MSLIPERYRKDGFDYVLVRAEHFPHRKIPEVLGMYEQYRNGLLIDWEVVRCRWQDEVVSPIGVVYKEGYKVPRTASWGHLGWTLRTRAEADQKFLAVMQHIAEE